MVTWLATRPRMRYQLSLFAGGMDGVHGWRFRLRFPLYIKALSAETRPELQSLYEGVSDRVNVLGKIQLRLYGWLVSDWSATPCPPRTVSSRRFVHIHDVYEGSQGMERKYMWQSIRQTHNIDYSIKLACAVNCISAF